jgi:hypothetical protein
MVCDLLQKLELLHAAGTQVAPHGQEIVKTLYEILNVLDSKGLALLAFDGIVVAATTFAAEKGGVFHRSGLPRWLAILVIILCVAGAALCVGVFRNLLFVPALCGLQHSRQNPEPIGSLTKTNTLGMSRVSC